MVRSTAWVGGIPRPWRRVRSWFNLSMAMEARPDPEELID